MVKHRSALGDELAAIAAAVVASGAISANGHGNISLRVPGRDEFLFSTAPTLHGLESGHVARISLDGTVLEGELPPINNAVVGMHTAIYQDRPETGCVLHTHSPCATAFAVAGKPIDCWVEAMAMFGLGDGVPIADYGPRGSDQAVANIRKAMTSATHAVLLANHGVLVFHPSARLAVQLGSIIEESAQMAIFAHALGGPNVIPAEMRAAALQRFEAFAAQGGARPKKKR